MSSQSRVSCEEQDRSVSSGNYLFGLLSVDSGNEAAVSSYTMQMIVGNLYQGACKCIGTLSGDFFTNMIEFV